MMFEFGIEAVEQMIAEAGPRAGQPIAGFWTFKFRGIEPWLASFYHNDGDQPQLWREQVRSKGGLLYWRYWPPKKDSSTPRREKRRGSL